MSGIIINKAEAFCKNCTHGLGKHAPNNGRCEHKLIFGDNCPCPRFEGFNSRTDSHMKFKAEDKREWQA